MDVLVIVRDICVHTCVYVHEYVYLALASDRKLSLTGFEYIMKPIYCTNLSLAVHPHLIRMNDHIERICIKKQQPLWLVL